MCVTVRAYKRETMTSLELSVRLVRVSIAWFLMALVGDTRKCQDLEIECQMLKFIKARKRGKA
jgi:hypothetical protein